MSPALLATDPLFGLPHAQASYVVIFAAFFGYVVWLHRGQRALRRRLEDAERRQGASSNEDR